jgi:hypothetical protein
MGGRSSVVFSSAACLVYLSPKKWSVYIKVDRLFKPAVEMMKEFGSLCWDIFAALGTNSRALFLPVVLFMLFFVPVFGPFISISAVLGLICFGIIRYRHRG